MNIKHAAAVVVVVVVAVVAACAHGADVSARLTEARAAAHPAGGTASIPAAIAWSDAVAAALEAGVASADDGDLDDALYVLRVVRPGGGGDADAPLAEARGRLLAAAGRPEEAEAAFVEAAKARPARSNLEPLLAAAQKRAATLRVRSLCVSGATILPVTELEEWVTTCAKTGGESPEVVASLFLPADRLRIESKAELPTAGAGNQCALRCRGAVYRAVAGCADDRCLGLAFKATEVCAATCRDSDGPAGFP
ncbi:MAG: hypothetical protein Q8O67_21270 [Deltaproteobacteria bacterium]|nr:hypothetical protein [Deltaproteobacteria bacterium]